MNLHQFDFEETKRFSSIFLDYINDDPKLRNFYNLRPNRESFAAAIQDRAFDDDKRNMLVNVLKKQYKDCDYAPSVAKNIESLNDTKSFTITTGHQLNIFTGPLYFIYKIATVINIAKGLKEFYPDHHFVPVYWMASEDHDFEEINNIRLFGKKYVWKTPQKGPVGKFDTRSMKDILDEIPDLPRFCFDAYANHANLSEATRYLVNYLFGEYGLVVLDADDATLKKQLEPIIRRDLFENSTYSIANETTEVLEKLDYKSQIFPRPVNFFYMENGLRERIEVDGESFKIVNTSQIFSQAQMEMLIENEPEKFSPNVVLRPVYQEIILPNLAYIGGPAELAYWLQLKGVFDHLEIPFPIIYPRMFTLLISKTISKKMNKLDMEMIDIFSDYHTIKEKLLHSDEESSSDLSEELSLIEQAFKLIEKKSGDIDRSLEGFVASEFKKVEKEIVNIQKKFKKAVEQKEEIKLNQIKGVLDKLFPNGNPQEREDNFLNFYINNSKFIDELVVKLDPFELKYNVFSEDA